MFIMCMVTNVQLAIYRDHSAWSHACCAIGLPEPPTLRIFSLVNCGGPIGTQVILEWAPPTNTGGEGVRIDHVHCECDWTRWIHLST